MAVAQLVLQSISVRAIGGIGRYFTYNFRVQTRLKVLELRVGAYRKLFAVTEAASPTRLGRGSELSEEERKRILGRHESGWYRKE